MKNASVGILVCLLSLPGQSPAASATSWVCQHAGLTREVVVNYPEAPARLPCKVFYAKPDENVLPRVLWEAVNTPGFCERTARDFAEKLGASGWHCRSAETLQ